jgi:hypothetical protein
MVFHKAIPVYQTVKFFLCFFDGFDKKNIIFVVVENWLAVIASMNNMVWDFRNNRAGTSWHTTSPFGEEYHKDFMESRK